MPAPESDKRTKLLGAAAALVHQRGFEATSLADIAQEAGVPVGNVYYYFKTKAEIAMAIVANQLAGVGSMRARWDALPSAQDRLAAFIDMTVANREMLASNGCPMGSLCSELQKVGSDLAGHASEPFAELLDWLTAQFDAIKRGKTSRTHAVHLLSALQGVSLLANGFHDPALVSAEADHLKKWVRSL